LLGCAGERAFREGQDLLAEGKLEEGLARIEEAAREAPADARIRGALINRRAEIANRLLAAAQSEQVAGRLDEAEALYRRVLGLDAQNERARSGLALVARDRRDLVLVSRAREAVKRGGEDEALRLAEQVLGQNPGQADMLAVKRQVEEKRAQAASGPVALASLYSRPLTLEFRDANLRNIFEALSRSTGINFIVDRDVRADARATVFVRQSPLDEAIDLILQSNGLQKKVLGPATVLIYPATPEKIKEHQDLIVRSFYLANAEAKVTAQLLRTILKSRDLFIDEKLNLIVIRDTPEAVRLAERLVALHDIADSEVMLEVEVLEVQRSRLLELGIRFPDTLGLTILPPTGASLLLGNLGGVNSDRLQVAVPGTTINFRREMGDVNLLANPRIRVKNREKARVLIGDRVPVITTTTTASGFASESVQYAEVGLKLEVEPVVSLREGVTMRVGLEVSSIAREVPTRSGGLAYQIGTRNANTVLKLKDGETQVLAGLLNNEERSTANRLPGLGDLPGVGRLFGSTRDNALKTEIVLSITPRLVRAIERLDAYSEEFFSGTETQLRTRPAGLQPVAAVRSAAATPGSPAAAGTGAALPLGAPQGDESAPPTSIRLAWQAPAQAKVGDTVRVELRVATDGALRSLPVQIGFNAAALQAVSVTEGGFFKLGGGASNFSSNVDNTRGRVLIGASRSGAGGARGEEALAVVTFRVLAEGAPEVRVLAASPIAVAESSVPPTLPPPLGLALGK
jgi:general secretion pathway protein D